MSDIKVVAEIAVATILQREARAIGLTWLVSLTGELIISAVECGLWNNKSREQLIGKTVNIAKR